MSSTLQCKYTLYILTLKCAISIFKAYLKGKRRALLCVYTTHLVKTTAINLSFNNDLSEMGQGSVGLLSSSWLLSHILVYLISTLYMM